MKVAALYDVHAMPWALEAVLAEVGNADAIVFGGDFVGGPYPRETLELVRAADGTVLRGNSERDPSERDRALLSPDELEWLAGLPLTATLDGVLYCHATPHDDMPITTAVTPDEAVAGTFDMEGTVVIGHTHHQFDRTVGRLRIVNAGSVGMPYEGEVAAFWLEVENGEPRFRKTPIDVERAAEAILASDWPAAQEFVAENVRAAASRDEAVSWLESRR